MWERPNMVGKMAASMFVGWVVQDGTGQDSVNDRFVAETSVTRLQLAGGVIMDVSRATLPFGVGMPKSATLVGKEHSFL